MSNCLGGDSYTRKYIVWSWPWGQKAQTYGQTDTLLVMKCLEYVFIMCFRKYMMILPQLGKRIKNVCDSFCCLWYLMNVCSSCVRKYMRILPHPGKRIKNVVTVPVVNMIFLEYVFITCFRKYMMILPQLGKKIKNVVEGRKLTQVDNKTLPWKSDIGLCSKFGILQYYRKKPYNF